MALPDSWWACVKILNLWRCCLRQPGKSASRKEKQPLCNSADINCLDHTHRLRRIRCFRAASVLYGVASTTQVTQAVHRGVTQALRCRSAEPLSVAALPYTRHKSAPQPFMLTTSFQEDGGRWLTRSCKQQVPAVDTVASFIFSQNLVRQPCSIYCTHR